MSDGPVTANVTLGDRLLAVVPAWVVIALPDYGPQRKSVLTMWDLMRDVAIKAGTLASPVRPSCTSDILPLFRRLAGLQWVNAGFASGFGWKGLMKGGGVTYTESAADGWWYTAPLPAGRRVLLPAKPGGLVSARAPLAK